LDVLTVKHIIDSIERLAPKILAYEYDNVGLLIGNKDTVVTGIVTGLELTEELILEAIQLNCNVIVVHHPLIFKPIASIQVGNPQADKIIALIKNNLSLLVAHTNLDMASNGLNDYVLKKLDIEPAESHSANIRIGSVESQRLVDLIHKVKNTLNLEYIHYCGDENRFVSRIGLCTGSGMSFYQEALHEGIDVYITGDLKYHDATYSVDVGIPIIDATHFGTEIVVADLLREHIEQDLKMQLSNSVSVYSFNKYKNPIKVL
jgi:GTP cyclohydrolase I